MRPAIPAIVLSGYLGAGKTTVLNHLLQRSGARLGVVINDFGDTNVDAGLVRGQIDEPASIAGGCLCCLPDAGGLEAALTRLAAPRLGLDGIVIESSGVAEPIALARLMRSCRVDRVRPEGIVEVVDATQYFDTIDTGDHPPDRFAATSVALINKIDVLAAGVREEMIMRIADRVRGRNPAAYVIPVQHGAIDPLLLLDPDQRVPMVQEELPWTSEAHDHDHPRAESLSVESYGCVDPGELLDLLESPPGGVYRIKGTVRVAERKLRSYVIQLVGRAFDIAVDISVAGRTTNQLVAIGIGWDLDGVRDRLVDALRPLPGPPAPNDLARLRHCCRLSRRSSE